MNYWEKESKYKSSDYRSRNFSGKWSKHFINEYVDSIFEIGNNKTQKKFSEYKEEHLPSSLYKFFPASLYSLIGLQSQSVYLSSPQKFNDPFDSYVCIETNAFVKLYLKSKLKEQGLISDIDTHNNVTENDLLDISRSWLNEDGERPTWFYPDSRSFDITIYEIKTSKSKYLKELIEQIILEARTECSQRIENIRNMQFKISCFSNFEDEQELLENSTMWSHYADNHSGFCVKYALDFNKLPDKEDVLCGLFPVSYTANVPKISPRELFRLKYDNETLELNKPILKTTLKTLTTKSRFWAYEKEWRLIINEQNSKNILNNTIPFLDVEAIYLGCRIETNLKKNLILFAENNNIKVYQTRRSNEKFKLQTTLQNLNSLKHEELFEKLNQMNDIQDSGERLEEKRRLFKEFDKN